MILYSLYSVTLLSTFTDCNSLSVGCFGLPTYIIISFWIVSVLFITAHFLYFFPPWIIMVDKIFSTKLNNRDDPNFLQQFSDSKRKNFCVTIEQKVCHRIFLGSLHWIKKSTFYSTLQCLFFPSMRVEFCNMLLLHVLRIS